MYKRFLNFLSKICVMASMLMLVSACDLMSKKVSFSSLFGTQKPQQQMPPPRGYSGAGAGGTYTSAPSPYGTAGGYPPPIQNTGQRNSWFGSSNTTQSPALERRRRPANNPNGAPQMSATAAPQYQSNPYANMNGMPYGGAPSAMPAPTGMPPMGASSMGGGGGFDDFYSQMPGGAPSGATSYPPQSGAYGQAPYAGTAYPPQNPSNTSGLGGGFDMPSAPSMPSMNSYDMPSMPSAPSDAQVQQHLQTLGWGRSSNGSYNPWAKYKPDPVFEPMKNQFTMSRDEYDSTASFEIAFLNDSYRKLSTVPKSPTSVDEMNAKRETFIPLEEKRDATNLYNHNLRTSGDDVGILGEEMHTDEMVEQQPLESAADSKDSTSFLQWLEDVITIKLGQDGNVYYQDNPHQKQPLKTTTHFKKSSKAAQPTSNFNKNTASQPPRNATNSPPPKVVPYKAPESIILSPKQR